MAYIPYVNTIGNVQNFIRLFFAARNEKFTKETVCLAEKSRGDTRNNHNEKRVKNKSSHSQRIIILFSRESFVMIRHSLSDVGGFNNSIKFIQIL